jgi:SAM-dependent methyltransferase
VPPENTDRLALSELPDEEKAVRSGSFGAAATEYERYRPGPPVDSVAWMVPGHVGTVVDLGAGTGALTRLLLDRADEVIAVEPDGRMRTVLTQEVPGARALEGRGDSMPLEDSSADAVLASSSWHWMDLVPTLHEVARVLVPGGTLGAVWSGPDAEGPFMMQARQMLADRAAAGGSEETAEPGEPGVTGFLLGDASRPNSSLVIPEGLPFDPPDCQVFTWEMALTADDLVGLLGTMSWVITMPEENRRSVLTEARRLLRELLGIEGEVTVDVAFRAEAYRTRRAD